MDISVASADLLMLVHWIASVERALRRYSGV